MKRSRWMAVAGAIGVAAITTAMFGFVARGSNASPPGAVSNTGTSIDLAGVSSGQRSALESTGVTGDPRLLGVRNGRGFYRFSSAGGRSCYAVGRAGSPPVFGSIACPEGFPSESTPILDQSTVSFDPSTGTTQLVAVEGIASDSVARIGVVDVSGAITYAKVQGNVYRLAKVPEAAVKEITAFDSSGAKIFSINLARG